MINFYTDSSDKAEKTEKLINDLYENILTIDLLNNDGSVNYSITEDNIVSESMTLKQTICDGEKFKYGGCIASEFDIQLTNNEEKSFTQGELVGAYIQVRLSQKYYNGYNYPSNQLYPSSSLFPGPVFGVEEFVLFVGIINSAQKDQSNPNVRNVIAYDPLALAHKKNISAYVQEQMRVSACTPSVLFSIAEYVSDFKLTVNRGDWSSKGIYNSDLRNFDWYSGDSQVSAGEVLRSICELSCGFGFFRPSDRTLRLVRFDDDFHGEETYEFNESFYCEESKLIPFEGIVFTLGGKKIGSQTYIELANKAKSGYYWNGTFTPLTDQNKSLLKNHYYDITNNILAWDCTSDYQPENLTTISVFGENFQDTINHDTDCFPCTVTVDGRPWVEVGDTIYLKTPSTNIYGEYLNLNGEVVETLAEAEIKTVKTRVMNRTLTGIKALTDNIDLKGEI